MPCAPPVPFPSFTNLNEVADELARRGDVKLRAMMTQAWRAQSCLGDLRQAADCTTLLASMVDRTKSEDTPGLMATERALMATAIMLYARATSTNGDKGERGSIQLSKKKLTPEQWTDHTALLDVRNQAMAHVYSSRRVADHDWHRDVCFAVNVGGGRWKAASASNQTSFHLPTLERLQRMLPIALREVKTKFHERMDSVTTLINSTVKAGLLAKHVFDPVRVFGSEDGVRLVLAGAAPGESSFWVNGG